MRIEAGESRTIDGKGGAMTLSAFLLQHGNIPALGYRFGDAAYTPDVSDIPPRELAALENLDLWIIDALRYRPHPSHFSVDDALSLDRPLQAAPRRPDQPALRSRLRGLRQSLPANVVPAYDGMRLTLSGGGEGAGTI